MADLPKDLLDAIAEGRCLIVCGAGVSLLATGGRAPGWQGLIRNALERAAPKLGNKPPWVSACEAYLSSKSTDDWLTAADEIQKRLGGRQGQEYLAFLRQALGELQATNPSVLTALLRLFKAGNRIATTSYDSLLGDSLGYDVVTWETPHGVVDAIEGQRKAIVHLYGHWRSPSSIVFSGQDYARARNEETTQLLRKLATHNLTLLFVGYSASGVGDENVGKLLQWFGKKWLGRGKKHYVLVREADIAAPWPTAVTQVVYGKEYQDLPAFLENLAARPPREWTPLPPNPRMIGRKDRLDEIVRHILDRELPVIVSGETGMGKTTLALAVAHDPGVKDRFGRARIFVNLQAATSADTMLRAIAKGLGIERSGGADAILDAVETYAASEPTLAVLDGIETPWSADPTKTQKFLGRLASIKGLRLIITTRGDAPPIAGGSQQLGAIKRLGPRDARQLFLRHSGERFAGDPNLSDLLAFLDGHPLLIVLAAGQTGGHTNLAALVQELRTASATLANHDVDEQLSRLPPAVPEQILGIHFGQTKDGRVDVARGAPLSDEERGRLSGLHEMMAEAAHDASERIRRSNGYRTLEKSTARYVRTLQRPTFELTDGDIEILYGCGLAFQAAWEILQNEILGGDAPPEDVQLAVPLKQLLGLHGPFLQSTKRGNELYDQTDRDRRTAGEDLALKERQNALNARLATATDVIAEEAAEVVDTITQTMGTGRHPERADVAGRSAIRNLWSAIARLASTPQLRTKAAAKWAAGGMATATLGKAFVSSKVGIVTITTGAVALDAIVGACGEAAIAAHLFYDRKCTSAESASRRRWPQLRLAAALSRLVAG